jgi:hypothetical protein
MRVVVHQSTVEIEIAVEEMVAKLSGGNESVAPKNSKERSSSRRFRLTCAFQLAHHRGELRLVLPNASLAAEQPNHSLVRSIARSVRWKERIIVGEIYSKEQLAAEANMNASYVGPSFPPVNV